MYDVTPATNWHGFLCLLFANREHSLLFHEINFKISDENTFGKLNSVFNLGEVYFRVNYLGFYFLETLLETIGRMVMVVFGGGGRLGLTPTIDPLTPHKTPSASMLFNLCICSAQKVHPYSAEILHSTTCQQYVLYL